MENRINKDIEQLIETSFLKEYIEDPFTTDISFNGTELRVQSNKVGRYQPEQQPSEKDVFELGVKIANLQQKEWNNNVPRLNTELDTYRVNFIHRVLSPSGCTFAIRISRPQLVQSKISDMANEDVEQLLKVLVMAESNIIAAGRTGSGKTEFQKLLAYYFEDYKKVTLLEDTMDSHLKEIYKNKDINSWRVSEEIGYKELTREALRNNPDWLIIAETRGSEAYDLLNAALTDHSVITTLHATDAPSIVDRLLWMIGQDYPISEVLLGRNIVNAFKFGLHLEMRYAKDKKGVTREMDELVEFTGFSLEKGAEYQYLYKKERKYNSDLNIYELVEIMNPLSENSLRMLESKELIHLVPAVFKTKRS